MNWSQNEVYENYHHSVILVSFGVHYLWNYYILYQHSRCDSKTEEWTGI